MSRINEIQKLNPEIEILPVDGKHFNEYGEIYPKLSWTQLREQALINFSENEDTSYIASSPELEACPEVQEFKRQVFGGTEIQVGCCWGINSRMNGMEYHKSSELIGAATDLILILGRVQDIKSSRWDSAKAEFSFCLPGPLLSFSQQLFI